MTIKEGCKTPGMKIRSKGKGRGLAIGKGKGPLNKKKKFFFKKKGEKNSMEDVVKEAVNEACAAYKKSKVKKKK